LKKLLLGVAAAAALATSPVFAHHSAAMFDSNKVVVLRGTMVSFTNMNPHAWISILGTPDDNGTPSKKKPERWDIEATAPITLAMQGIQSDTLKPGDKLTIAIRPLRDGRNGGSLVLIVTPDGVPHGAKPEDVGLDIANLKAF
jgi:Family of unknown function (DUF6152)